MKSTDFIAAARRAAALPSCYMLGPWGWTCTDAMIDRATTQGPHAVTNQQWRPEAIKCRDKGGYIWDCVGLIKGILWGWSADRSKKYGGAGYACNGVPDYGADQMIRTCHGGSADWSRIDPGEVVWMTGHIGIYVGGGVVIEATPKWDNGVQQSALLNTSEGRGLGWAKGRKWTRHGKLPYVDYTNTDTSNTNTDTSNTDTSPSPWAMDAWNAAKKAGITDGTRPHGTATREQVIAMLYRCGVIPNE